MPLDAQRIGIDFDSLQGVVQSVGIGGASRDYEEGGALLFSDPGVALHFYALDLIITAPSPDIFDVPSLLGRDVLSRWRVIVDYEGGELSCGVRSSDRAVAIAPSQRGSE